MSIKLPVNGLVDKYLIIGYYGAIANEMIKVANIIPTDYLLQDLSPLDFLPQIHLLLAHQTLVDRNYVDCYSKRKAAGDYIILDNSAFEFGEAMSPFLLEKAIEIVQPHEFVLPDTLFEKDQTIKRSNEFISSLKKNSLKYMAVVQGKTLKEWMSCYEYFSKENLIYSIGLGAIYTPKTIFGNNDSDHVISGREFLINKLIEAKLLNTNKPHHLLGLGDSGHLEIQKLKKHKWIRSCDSSAAYIQAKHGLQIPLDKEYVKFKEKIDFSDKFDKKTMSLLSQNTSTLYEAGK